MDIELKGGKRVSLGAVIKAGLVEKVLGMKFKKERALPRGSRILGHGKCITVGSPPDNGTRASDILDTVYAMIYGGKRRNGWDGNPETQEAFYPAMRR